MTPLSSTTSPVVRVAIDVAKLTHQVLLELPTGKRRALRVPNTRSEIEKLVTLLRYQRYLDPLVTGHQDLQELANTCSFEPSARTQGPRGRGHLTAAP